MKLSGEAGDSEERENPPSDERKAGLLGAKARPYGESAVVKL